MGREFPCAGTNERRATRRDRIEVQAGKLSFRSPLIAEPGRTIDLTSRMLEVRGRLEDMKPRGRLFGRE
jgi:hypothetical protein